jgi:simple sugar transport system ATP-binding protein
MAREAGAMLARLSRNLPPISAETWQLSGGQRQAIAIARATAWGSKVIIMDEPTAALGPAETRSVEEVIRELRERGFAVLIISHNLEQVFRLVDRVWVMRRGRMIGSRLLSGTTPDEIVGMITGASAVLGSTPLERA